MAKSKPKSRRKTRSDKFPLTLHPTRQYCKKIKGKLYYFGADKQQALERYLEQAAYLHAGKPPKSMPAAGRLSIKTRWYLTMLVNTFYVGTILRATGKNLR